MSLKVDLLRDGEDKSARRTTALIAVVFTLFVGVTSACGAYVSYQAASRQEDSLQRLGKISSLIDFRRLVFGRTVQASDPVQTEDGRINILLLGIGGAGHAGAELTDTIMLASIDTNTKRVALLSIPRDLAYPLGDTRFQKINAVNTYAEIQHPGEGARYAADDIGKLFGVRIDRVIKVDFKGFEKFVDSLNGIDVDVERSFVDTSYPTNDERWQTISFKAGMQHMNGAQALMYTRSRHGNNGEGSDFARSRRQQLVLTAIREKLFALGTLSNPTTMGNLWSSISSHVETDFTVWDAIKMAPLLSALDTQHITNHVLTDDPEGQLVAANVNGAFMLFPRKPDWSEIRDLAANPFSSDDERKAAARPHEEVRLEIKNGTTRTGLAAQVSGLLKKDGYVITGTENAAHKGYERTIIFDLTSGKKTGELARLKNILHANVSTASPSTPSGSNVRVVYTEAMDAEPVFSSSSDFLVILGESSAGLVETVVLPTTDPRPTATSTAPTTPATSSVSSTSL